MNHNFTIDSVIRKQKRVEAIPKRIFHLISTLVGEIIILGIIAIPVFAVAWGIGVYSSIVSKAPSIDSISVVPTKFSSFVLDSEGNRTATLVMEDSNRIPIGEDKLNENLKNAFIAIEDERFYSHKGIDFQGIVRAGVDVITTKSLSQGASTITQQLLKNNVFLGWMEESSYMDSVLRKLQEQHLAIKLESVMTKDEILLNYLNTINLGQNTLGVEAAALRYFNKNAKYLTLSECAVLAGITQNPSKYNPITNPSENAARRMKVLQNMLRLDMITQKEYDEAVMDPVYSRIREEDVETGKASINSYFVDSLTKVLLEDLQAAGYSYAKAFDLLYSGGLRIYSTQDPKIQGIADRIFSDEANYPGDTQWLLSYRLTTEGPEGKKNYSTEMLKSYFLSKNRNYKLLYNKKEKALEDVETFKTENLSPKERVLKEDVELVPQQQISLTIEDQHTGHVVAMVGGRGDKTASRTLNRATDSYRQPGSTFKVVSTYVPALDEGGFFLESTQVDSPFVYESGVPVNNWYDGYRGVQTLRAGIKDSLNIIAVKTLTDITPRMGYRYLKKLGFTTLVDDETIGGVKFTDVQQSLALGGVTKGVFNIELNASYAAIANDGEYIKPKLYTKVEDSQGNLILTSDNYRREQVMKRATAYYITDALKDVVTSGTGTACNFNRNMAIAGKTGTTSKYVDQWFTGFTPYYTASVWTGIDDNTPLNTPQKRALAKTMWTKTMKAVHEELELPEVKEFEKPRDLEKVQLCRHSGLLPGSGCTKTREHLLDKEKVPTATCSGEHKGEAKFRERGSDFGEYEDMDGILGLDPNQMLLQHLQQLLGQGMVPGVSPGMPAVVPGVSGAVPYVP